MNIQQRMRELLEANDTTAFCHSIDDLRARGIVIDGDVPTVQLVRGYRPIPIRVSTEYVEPGQMIFARVPPMFVGDPGKEPTALKVGPF